MKRKLQFCLAVILGLTASVGWFHAQEDTPKVKITTDLIGTQVNNEITYGVSTFPDATLGNLNVIVEMALTGTNNPDLKDWNVQYYEVKTKQWMSASAYITDGVYTFGPSTGFPLQTATSYFRMTPKAEGTYQYKLTIKKADTKEIVATKDFGLTVAAGYPVLVNQTSYGAVGISNRGLYASLGTAVNFAEEGDKLSLSSGTFVLSPGTKEVQGQSGWYLPIDKKGLTIEGKGQETSLVPDQAIVPNTNLPSQNFITVLSDDVTIQNMKIVTKLEANKVVEVLGKNITLKNLEFTRLGSADGATYAGSVYFNPSDKNMGTVTLSDLKLLNGRISFTGATKGEVTMNNIWIEYKDLKIADRVLGNNSIQDYPPFGAINNKPELKINGHESVKVTFYKSDAKYYQLDANTVANMPAEAVLALTPGTFELSSQLVINKPLVLSGAAGEDGKPQTILKAKADANWPASNDKKNLISIEGNGTGTVKLLRLYVSESKASGINAQSAMTTEISNVALEKSTNAGMLIHSKVVATGLLTIQNGWGGVNIDKGTPAYAPFFEFDATSNFFEQSKIWAEDITSDAKTLVKVPNDTWSSYVGIQGTNANKMRYWTNSTLTQDGNTVYANGNPITIKAAGEEGQVIVYPTNDESDFILLESKNATVYGGAKNKNVESSTITMESGSIKNLFGGGLGELATKTQADVKTKTTITIKGGSITNLLVGGGQYYAKSNEVAINVTGDQTSLDNVICGGYDAGETTNTLNTSLAESVNGVQKFTLNMTGGEITEGIGCGGGQGYSYTGTSTVNLNGVKIASFYGVLSNGRADNITAIVTNCTFAKNGDWYELASVNRGTAKNIDFTFDGCTFNETGKMNACLGPINGWADSDTDGKIVPVVTGTTKWVFKNTKGDAPVMQAGQGLETANIELTGAAAKIAKFYKTTGSQQEEISTFELGARKTWAFNKGFTIAEGATLTNKGTLVIPAADIMVGITVGGDLQVAATSKDILNVMNNADNKADLKDKVFTITCNDGVITPTKEKAKELLKAGKNAMLLSFDKDTYSVAVYSITLARITNLPDSVVFGTQPITLAFNLANTEVTAKTNTDNAVKLENNVLTILKPGIVTFELKVKEDTNNDGKIDASDTSYDKDAASTQTLKVTKRKITLTEGLAATARDYDGGNTVTLTKSTLKFAGKLGTDATGLDLTAGFKGELQDANAGDNKAVVVTATLDNTKDSTAYYELAPITFVKAKVKPKAVTVTAANITDYNYGSEIPAFTVSYSPALVSGDKLDGILKFNCTATKESLVKEDGYDIMPYGLTSNNYAITFTKGTLTVNPVNPQIELVEAKTVINGANRDIQVKAKLIDKGGVVATTDATVTFKYGENGTANGTLTDGYYTATITNPGTANYAITASATVGKKTGTSKGINVTIDAKKLQTVTFGKSVLPTMVYGNEIALTAISDQAAAKGEYAYKVESVTGTATITDGKLKATKAGKVTLTVTRAADAEYSAASAIQTIEITPKPITVAVGEIQKAYDGTTTVTTLPTLTLAGVLSGDDATIKTEGLSLSYANKNAADKVNVLMPELVLKGAAAANYALIQPATVTGKITKAPLTVKVKDVTRMWNQRYTKYEFEATGLQNDEPLNVAYTGILNVSESGENLNLTMDQAKCPNYTIEAQPGKLTVQMGAPKAVVYGMNTSANTIQALLIDEAGYTGLTVDKVTEEDKVYAVIKSGDKTIAQSINNITIVTSPKSFSMPATKAAGDWNDASFKPVAFGTTGTEAIVTGSTFMSSNPNVLTVELSSGKTDEITYKAIGTGKATIVVVGGTATKIKNFKITPKELKYTATMDKAYDGTTVATGTITLTGADAGADVALDIENVTFNFDSKNAGATNILASQQPILTGSAANNYTLVSDVKGKISKKELEVKSVTAYYNGTSVITLADYTAEGLISGDVVPVKATFAANAVGSALSSVALTTTGDAGNYTLKTGTSSTTGTILKSTVVATLPSTASSIDNLKNNIKLAIRETGESVSAATIQFAPTATSDGSGSNTVYYVNGGATSNYSVVYDKNQLGFKSDPTPTPDPVPVTGISLDKTELTLPRLSTYTLIATVAPNNADNKSVKWTSSDESIATVDANGKVTAVKVGKATITVTTVDGSKMATCQVTVDFATGMEEDLANTKVYTRNGMIYINPIQPLQATIISMAGKAVYDAHINGAAQISVAKGIYIVKLTNAGNTITTKVSVY